MRFRFAPVYTFLEETDLTNYYDRWNIICGPWILRLDLRRPVVHALDDGRRPGRRLPHAGVRRRRLRGLPHRLPRRGRRRRRPVGPRPRPPRAGRLQRRAAVDHDRCPATTTRSAAWPFARYIFLHGDSLYLPPAHYIEAFTAYQQNFLPVPEGDGARRRALRPGRRRPACTTGSTILTPYWDPEGGFKLDLLYEAGVAGLETVQGLNEALRAVFDGPLPAGPDAGAGRAVRCSRRRPGRRWNGWPTREWRCRIYGATGLPTRGEFFTMGGDDLFRGFDQSQRAGQHRLGGQPGMARAAGEGADVGRLRPRGRPAQHLRGGLLRRGRRLPERPLRSGRWRTRSAAACGWTCRGSVSWSGRCCASTWPRRSTTIRRRSSFSRWGCRSERTIWAATFGA